jgi:hypothetical protein
MHRNSKDDEAACNTKYLDSVAHADMHVARAKILIRDKHGMNRDQSKTYIFPKTKQGETSKDPKGQRHE